MTRLALVGCLSLAACSPPRPVPDPPCLAVGTWTGGLAPMHHPDRVTPLTYRVGYDGDALTLAVGGPDGVAIPARDVALRADTLRFVFDEPEEGVPLRCALGAGEAGAFEGRCADASGKWARFTMTPPAR